MFSRLTAVTLLPTAFTLYPSLTFCQSADPLLFSLHTTSGFCCHVLPPVLTLVTNGFWFLGFHATAEEEERQRLPPVKACRPLQRHVTAPWDVDLIHRRSLELQCCHDNWRRQVASVCSVCSTAPSLGKRPLLFSTGAKFETGHGEHDRSLDQTHKHEPISSKDKQC